jgi:predicted nucleotidyltransferase/HEPN domain-containing protein
MSASRRRKRRAGREPARADHYGLGIQRGACDSALMKTRLDHLPVGKRRELAYVVEIVREGFAKAIEGRRAPRFKNGGLLKIILFGSYARGDWVEDPVGRYFSDFDILVVVDHEDLADVGEFWLPTEDRLIAETGAALRTPVSIIYHSLDDVNEQLRLGRYFFMDIVRDGIVLFEELDHPFAEAQPLEPQQALRETNDYFAEWFESADRFFQNAKDDIARGWNKEAAFLLHQSSERFYHCLFLVRTLYSPKTHNLNRLRTLSEDLEPSLKEVWPHETKFQRRCYELLRAAYVKARYSRHYRITAEELTWLAERITLLRDLVEKACLERIAALTGQDL